MWSRGIGRARCAPGRARTRGPRGDECGSAAEGDSGRGGGGLASEVVFGGTEAAGEDDDIATHDCGAGNANEMIEGVSNDGFEADVDAELVELAGQEQGIGILTERSEHLRADRNDFSDHVASLALEKK